MVIDMPEGTIIKRVAYLPGETYAQKYHSGDVTGTVSADVTLQSDRASLTPLRVPNGMVYVLGDNSTVSRDSRSFGPIPRSWVSRKIVVPKPYDRPEYGSTSRTGDM